MRKKLLEVLINASAAHKKKARQMFQNMDLSDGQPKVLAHLHFHEGCPQKELAEGCCVEPATMTSLLRSMESKGLIRKKAVHISGGKRALGISLTELGRTMASRSIDIIDEIEEMSFSGFSEDDKDKLVELLQRMTDNLTEQ